MSERRGTSDFSFQPPRQGEAAKALPIAALRLTLSRVREIEEDDDRRIADGGVMAGEDQAARFVIHAEGSDVVAALVAGVEELAGGVEVEAARVIPTRPFLAHEGQLAVFADGEDADAVVEAVARIDEVAIGGNQDLGAEITALES